MSSRRAANAAGRVFTWFSGAMLAIGLLMIGGLLSLIIAQGLGAFWPQPLMLMTLESGKEYLGYVHKSEASPEGGRRMLVRTGNRDFYGADFKWIDEAEVVARELPESVVVIERLEWGPFFGTVAFVTLAGEQPLGGQGAWRLLKKELPKARKRSETIRRIEREEIGPISAQMEKHRLALKRLRAGGGPDTEEGRAAVAEHERELRELDAAFAAVSAKLAGLRSEDEANKVTLKTVEGREKVLPVSSIVRVFSPNRLSPVGKLGVYLSRLREFVFDEPREANSEGGVAPAIFGTVLMTLLMVVFAVPLGVMAALYLHEYAKQGFLVSLVRIAVNNLAGVPSIVFGVFGLGFFIYMIGGTIDSFFFSDRLPTPTFGGGGILWASLTLALLTVPVVIVATEEALVAVPRSMREASYAMGATKFQTIWKVVLPAALPGILTGAILAMARGAGEVAPLMITGVVKLAPELPLDMTAPFLHLERRFMHLGFHIYDVGFQSPNVEAAKPMVFMTTLLLVGIVLVLNFAAMMVRGRLRERFHGAKV